MASKEKAAGGAAGVLILAIVALGLGFYAGYVTGGKQQWSVGYSAGEAATKKALASRLAVTLGAVPAEEDVKTVSGKIVEKTADGIVIETPQLVRDPLAEPAPLRRTVRFASATKITVAEPVPADKFAALDEEYRKQQDAYLKAIAEGQAATAPVPPNPLEERDGAASDLAVGEDVTVTADAGILRAAVIDAATIRVSPVPSAPAAPASGSGSIPATGTSAQKPAASSAGVPATGTSSGKVPTAPATNAPSGAQ